MITLALDPSSSCTGYAIFTSGGRPGAEPELVDAGKLTPDRVKDSPNKRIRAMLRDLRTLMIEHKPHEVVIEDTSGKVARGGHGRGMNGAGLAIYGKAVGAIIFSLMGSGVPVVCWLENDWTRGTKKFARQRGVIAIYRGRYDPAADPGMDVSDAIALGRARCLTRDVAGASLKPPEILEPIK